MVRIGLVVRVLMLAACVVPFTSPRQAFAAVPSSLPAPGFPAPAPFGGQEEDTEREEEVTAKEAVRTLHPTPHRTSAASRPDLLFSAHHRRPTTAVRAPAPADPFRNGLGSPYRC